MSARAHLLSCWANSAMMLGDYTTVQEKLENAAIYIDHINLGEEFDRISWLQLAGKKAPMAGEQMSDVLHLLKQFGICYNVFNIFFSA